MRTDLVAPSFLCFRMNLGYAPIVCDTLRALPYCALCLSMKSLMAGSPLAGGGRRGWQRQAACVRVDLLPQEPRLNPLLAEAACSSYVRVAAAGQLCWVAAHTHLSLYGHTSSVALVYLMLSSSALTQHFLQSATNPVPADRAGVIASARCVLQTPPQPTATAGITAAANQPLTFILHVLAHAVAVRT